MVINSFEVAFTVTAAAGGDESAWGRLVDQFSGLVWSVARSYRLSRADTADVFQTTWLRLAEHLSGLREPGRVGAWLATTAGREALELIRQSRRQVPTDLIDLTEVPDHAAADQPEDWVLMEERDAALWRAFRSLPVRAQVLLGMLFADPAPSYAEVAEATGMPVGSIGPTRSRYLAQLRSRLEAPLAEPALV